MGRAAETLLPSLTEARPSARPCAPLPPDRSPRAHMASLAGLPPKPQLQHLTPHNDKEKTSLQRKGCNEKTSHTLTTLIPPSSTWD